MNDLVLVAKRVRREIILMSLRASSAHMGGSLSCVEILVTLYFSIMRVDPKNPFYSKRDRLIFSKAHDVKALYAVLAERGYFSRDLLGNYEKDGAILAGHSIRHAVPGIEVSAGSLGHGLSISCGMAYAGKNDKRTFRVFTILSDGECEEGSTWEAFLFAGHHKLNNLVVIIDYNKLQGFGRIEDILGLEPFTKKLESFNWNVIEVDGHSIVQLNKAFKRVELEKNKPSVIIAHTQKGFGGVPEHLNKVSSHYKPPTKEQAEEAIAKLGKL